MNHLCVDWMSIWCSHQITEQINRCLVRRWPFVHTGRTTNMVSDRHMPQGMCSVTKFRGTSKRIDCTRRSSKNIVVDKVVVAERSLCFDDPTMAWQSCCIHLNRWWGPLTPVRCQWNRWVLSISFDATEMCRCSAFYPLLSATTSVSMIAHRFVHVSICSVDFGTRFSLGSPSDWAYAPVVHVQVPTNIAAVESGSPIRALVPARIERAAFVCFEVYHFYVIHIGTMSPLVGCSSLLGINRRTRECKSFGLYSFSSQMETYLCCCQCTVHSDRVSKAQQAILIRSIDLCFDWNRDGLACIRNANDCCSRRDCCWSLSHCSIVGCDLNQFQSWCDLAKSMEAPATHIHAKMMHSSHNSRSVRLIWCRCYCCLSTDCMNRGSSRANSMIDCDCVRNRIRVQSMASHCDTDDNVIVIANGSCAWKRCRNCRCMAAAAEEAAVLEPNRNWNTNLAERRGAMGNCWMKLHRIRFCWISFLGQHGRRGIHYSPVQMAIDISCRVSTGVNVQDIFHWKWGRVTAAVSHCTWRSIQFPIWIVHVVVGALHHFCHFSHSQMQSIDFANSMVFLFLFNHLPHLSLVLLK